MAIIHRSKYSYNVPDIDLLSYIFASGDEQSRQRPQYFDAFRPERYYSLAQGEIYAKRVGLGLRKLGLSENDKVVLYATNNLFFPVLLWGVIAAGGVFSAVAHSASASELEGQLKDLEAAVLLTSLEGLETARKAAEAAGIPTQRIFVFCDPLDEADVKQASSFHPWTAFWVPETEVANWSWKRSSDPTYLAEKTVIINYSSGTTGPPKGVQITHQNVVSNSAQLIYYRTLSDGSASANARQDRLGRSGERWLAPLPMYHAYGQMYYCINAPRLGAKVYIMARYEISLLLLFLDIYRITFLTGVPTVMVQIAKQRRGVHNLNALEYALTGSAPLGAAIGAEIERDFLPAGLTVKQGWGMTETTCSMSGFTPDDTNDGSSVGYLNPNCQGKIVPVEDRTWSGDAPEGCEVGELWVSGANVTKGYYNRPQQTAETIVVEDGERWLRTGDIGYFDAEGKIFLIDRLKDLIKVKGLQVSPSELEAAILLHSGVSDVAVVGAKIEHGEYPRAFVVKRDSNLTEDMIHSVIKDKFSRHKWLTGGVFFVDEIPKTASGKVMRRKLPNVSERRQLKL